MKIYSPIQIDISDKLKFIEDEIILLKSLRNKSDYIINYLDSFIEEISSYKIYNIVTNFYEVKFDFI